MKKLRSTPESRKLAREVLKWRIENFDKLCGIGKVNNKLELFTPEAKQTINLKPEITHKMKKIINSIKKAVIHLNILGLLFLFSCGTEDNPITGNPPVVNNDSLVLSLDSFNLTGTGSISKDTLFNLIDSTYDSLKITFDVVSNCDTLDNAVLNVSFGNAGLLFFYRDLNASYTLYSAKNSSFWFALFSQFNTSQQRYIKAKNFKLYLR